MVALLKRELGVEPDAATKALARELRKTAGAGEDLGARLPSAARAAAHGQDPLPLPDCPSIAVLPFANMSGDPDQEYFADGISEDLITGLSRIRWLFVIARNSTFVYKHRAVDVKQVSRELGVRYVLEGSVRRAGNRLRISAQLIDAMTGGHHWAERYDRKLGDIFAVQDEITRSVAAAIEPRLLAAEGVRALSRSAEDLGAWDLVARAQTHVWRLTRSDYETAIDALKRAVEAYPEYAPARSLLGFCLVFAAHMGWVDRDEGMLPAATTPLAQSRSMIAIPGDTSRSAMGSHGKAHRGVDRGVSSGGQPQSEFGGSPLSSQPRLGFCRAGSRSDRAWRRCHQAQSLGSGDGAVPRRYRGCSLYGRAICRGCSIHDGNPALAPRFSGSATFALCEPGPGRAGR